jgi:hypothetical protein
MTVPTAYCHICKRGVTITDIRAQGRTVRDRIPDLPPVVTPAFARLTQSTFDCGHMGWRILTLEQIGTVPHHTAKWRRWFKDAVTVARLEDGHEQNVPLDSVVCDLHSAGRSPSHSSTQPAVGLVQHV